MSMPGFWEFVALGVLALLIFGPDKLPGMARTVGRTITQFRREAQQALDELKRAAEVEELRKVGEELKSTGKELQSSVTAIEREAASAGSAATRPHGETIVGPDGPPTDQGTPEASGEKPAAALSGPPPFDPDAT